MVVAALPIRLLSSQSRDRCADAWGVADILTHDVGLLQACDQAKLPNLVNSITRYM